MVAAAVVVVVAAVVVAVVAAAAEVLGEEAPAVQARHWPRPGWSPRHKRPSHRYRSPRRWP
jgi:hypothetical protein